MSDPPSRYGARVTEEEFHDLYRALRDPIFTFAVRRVGTQAAADVVSETFEVVWRKRAELPSDQATRTGWVVGVAKNKVLQELQRRARKHHDHRFTHDWHGPWPAPVAGDVAETVVDGDDALWVYHELTINEQLLFDIAFIREHTPAGGAALLGISKTAYTSRVGRLRHRLRSLTAGRASGPGSPTSPGGEPS